MRYFVVVSMSKAFKKKISFIRRAVGGSHGGDGGDGDGGGGRMVFIANRFQSQS